MKIRLFLIWSQQPTICHPTYVCAHWYSIRLPNDFRNQQGFAIPTNFAAVDPTDLSVRGFPSFIIRYYHRWRIHCLLSDLNIRQTEKFDTPGILILIWDSIDIHLYNQNAHDIFLQDLSKKRCRLRHRTRCILCFGSIGGLLNSLADYDSSRPLLPAFFEWTSQHYTVSSISTAPIPNPAAVHSQSSHHFQLHLCIPYLFYFFCMFQIIISNKKNKNINRICWFLYLGFWGFGDGWRHW